MSTDTSKYGQLWTREESILAFFLYCQIPFQKTKANNPAVRELAAILNRTPASVARKLGNFGSFDPILQQRGISGLANTGETARQVWEEFHNDWNGLVIEAEAIRNSLGGIANTLRDELERPSGSSERTATRKERLHQSFFRMAVMTSYLDTCCVTGITIPECLVASHIVPWSRDESSRTDPTNGLCLSATFDKLFDHGLVTIDDEFKIMVSERLLRTDSRDNRDHIVRFHGRPIHRPHRFMPDQRYLHWHRKNLFCQS